MHPGQGTRNRKFYFENFFLEIIWESDEEELRSELIAPLHLWERVHYQVTGNSPFGLILAYTDDTNALFGPGVTYQPEYTPPGIVFTVLPHHTEPYLPWTCRLPETMHTFPKNEPIDHAVGIRELSRVTVSLSATNYQNAFTKLVEKSLNVAFKPAEQPHITLEFDHQQQGKSHTFQQLPLTIVY